MEKSRNFAASAIDADVASEQKNCVPESVYKVISRSNGIINRARIPQIKRRLTALGCSRLGSQPVLRKRLKVIEKIKSLENAGYYWPRSAFNWLLILDVVCADENPSTAFEIVQIFALVVQLPYKRNHPVLEQFYSVVKPKIQTTLSEERLHQLGLSQGEINRADSIQFVLQRFSSWLSRNGHFTGHIGLTGLVVENSNKLEKCLVHTCTINKVSLPYWASCWIALNKSFVSFYNIESTPPSITHAEWMLEQLGRSSHMDGRGVVNSVVHRLFPVVEQMCLDRCIWKSNATFQSVVDTCIKSLPDSDEVGDETRRSGSLSEGQLKTNTIQKPRSISNEDQDLQTMKENSTVKHSVNWGSPDLTTESNNNHARMDMRPPAVPEYEKSDSAEPGLRETHQNPIEATTNFAETAKNLDGIPSISNGTATTPTACGDKATETCQTLTEGASNPTRTAKHPIKTTENPTETALNPTVTTQNPAEVTQNPIEAAQSPTETAQNPSETTQDPTRTTQNSIETTQDPLETAQNLIETTQNPTETTQNPTKTTQTSVETAQNLKKSTMYSTETTKDPIKIAQNPSEFTQNPTETTQKPDKTTQTSLETAQSLNETTPYTIETTQDPIKTAQNQTETVQNPTRSCKSSNVASLNATEATLKPASTSELASDSNNNDMSEEQQATK